MKGEQKPMSAERLAEILAQLNEIEPDDRDPCDITIAELLAELARLRGPGGWIRTGERLPEEFVTVWGLWSRNPKIPVRVQWVGTCWLMPEERCNYRSNEIILWRPVIVPDPPGEGANP